jgi:hypothetical protein
MGGQPDAGEYEELIAKLSRLEQRDALTASFYALSWVIQFLHVDARVTEREYTRPLCRLAHAILDRVQGGRPKLLFDPPDRNGAKGAPSYTSAAVLRALVNAAFLTLREGGMSNEEAGNWLAAELEHSGVKQPNGKAITAKTIIRWRQELGAKSPKGSDEAFGMFVHGGQCAMLEKAGQTQPSPDTSLDRQGSQIAARHYIKMLRIDGF